jgi:RNA ligase (TIGR02306 family)
MRKLASIQKIVNIEPIPGADKIVLATVLGWKCITAIDNGFNTGDLCVYFEIDSKLDKYNPAFSFMEKRNWNVKTMKMRGVYSYGLIMPISILPCKAVEGMDVTDILKVTKINEEEPEVIKKHSWLMRFRLYRYIKSLFRDKYEWPQEIPHTDETRIQAIYDDLKPAFSTKRWYASIKIDGQSATYYYKRGWRDFFGIYSRTMRKNPKENSTWSRVAKDLDIKRKLKSYGNTVWIQGEIAAPGIQKNRYKLDRLTFFVFNVYVPNIKEYLEPVDMNIFCSKLGFTPVPIYDSSFDLSSMSVDDLVDFATKADFNGHVAEGLVFRELDDFSLNRISFKVINPDYLIKHNI